MLLAGGCYCKALTPLCSAVRGKSSCPLAWRRQRGDAWTEDTLFFPAESPACSVEFEAASMGGGESAMSPDFSQPLILKCPQSSSIRGSEVSGDHVCHNLLVIVHFRCRRRGQKINKLDWAARPGGGSSYPALIGRDSTLLHQVHLFSAVWSIELNFIKKSHQE